ncbi:DVUA0089 family protein [Aestuariirhabdus sp. Z084]|uniref:DVUA0089 family protein n=1 Tax=Aestuariirhabdus haliotis TaxID=2918751 RepID=UPI00201B37E4|nr:DVUA0089 family protein [Aestuariirhabdus haliotis]MCL6414364.1 DVUA0089 family protein [Aestuariirhabdus haliotis]MCL6418296.1 DVUA0089 family protein [Aestuariirhabdus haliotis]
MKKGFFLIAMLLCSVNVHALAMSYTGNFSNDDARFYTSFTVTQESTVNLTSWGYAGGTNGAGNVIADGGFDTQLFLFDSAGDLVEDDDDASNVNSASSGNSWDALLSLILDAGSYVAVLTQYNNDFESGDLFTGVWSGAGTSNFVDDDNNQRTSAYAFDISGEFVSDVRATTVPEPETLVLFALGLLGIGAAKRRKAS